MTLSLEVRANKTKEAPSPHEVKLALLDTNPVFRFSQFSHGVSYIVCTYLLVNFVIGV